jgi:DNA replication and repair protein RecF
MKLKSLVLKNFRNHSESYFECVDGVNALLGENGEGKTNVLEAISFLCLTKSFFGASERVIVQFGKPSFEVTGKFESENRNSYSVRATYDGEQTAKAFYVNGAPVEPLSSLIGEFPVVVLSPEHRAITFGTPADRRRFIDLLISQASRSYFEDLLEYRRVLRQRNKLLSDARTSGKDCSSMLEPWNESLLRRGSRITHRRWQFAREFKPFIERAYRDIAGSDEIPEMIYMPRIEIETADDVAAIERHFRSRLQMIRDDELRMGASLLGPHRDELEFQINGNDLRKFASQGQHKTFLLALKIGEFFYLKERRNETPTLLLDDVFSELDNHRCDSLLHIVETLGQTFITTTNELLFPPYYEWGTARKKHHIRQGSLVHEP